MTFSHPFIGTGYRMTGFDRRDGASEVEVSGAGLGKMPEDTNGNIGMVIPRGKRWPYSNALLK
ncbi:MAG: hypothetical protein N838_20390 [Thiohalocapsa sp. PB-PSB1]|nr:MAG: hypothetical protein N838_20390 [Thiohalocapsa sp. PB-PSB1]